MTLLGDILSYAFRGNGGYMLIIGAVLSVIQSIASVAPGIGFFAFLILACYFCAFYFDVVQSTANGEDDAPEFPGASNLIQDIVWPAVQTLVVLLVSMLPLLAYQWFGPPASERSEPMMLALIGVGAAYFPMALLAVVILGRLSAASPHIVLPSILRAGWLYWLAVFLLFVVYMGESVLGSMLKGFPIVGSLVMAVVSMYTLLTNGRVMGMIYRERSEELNWL